MKLLYLFNMPMNTEKANIIQVIKMCNAFQKIGVDVTLALPKRKCSPENIEIIEREMNIPVQFNIKEYNKYTIKKRLSSLGTYWGIKTLLDKKIDFDYCFVRNLFLASLSLRKGIRTIHELHEERLHGNRLINNLYCRKLLKNAYSVNLIKFVVISHKLHDIWVERGIPPEKILVLHDAVDAKEYETVISRKEARLALGVNYKYKEKIVVYVGSLYEDRGIENILKLAATFSKVSFMVVGGPEDQKEFYQLKTDKLGLTNINFVGRVPHHKVKYYLFSADVLLMLYSRNVPTINVCSPLKMFESMAAERIIVGYGFPTIREILKDGETALLANPDSYHDLERKLQHSLSLDYPNDIAKNARSTVLNEHSWDGRARSIIEAL